MELKEWLNTGLAVGLVVWLVTVDGPASRRAILAEQKAFRQAMDRLSHSIEVALERIGRPGGGSF